MTPRSVAVGDGCLAVSGNTTEPIYVIREDTLAIAASLDGINEGTITFVGRDLRPHRNADQIVRYAFTANCASYTMTTFDLTAGGGADPIGKPDTLAWAAGRLWFTGTRQSLNPALGKLGPATGGVTIYDGSWGGGFKVAAGAPNTIFACHSNGYGRIDISGGSPGSAPGWNPGGCTPANWDVARDGTEQYQANGNTIQVLDADSFTLIGTIGDTGNKDILQLAADPFRDRVIATTWFQNTYEVGLGRGRRSTEASRRRREPPPRQAQPALHRLWMETACSSGTACRAGRGSGSFPPSRFRPGSRE